MAELCDAAIEAGEELDEDSWNLLYLRPDGWWLLGYGWDTEEEAIADGIEQVPPNVKFKAVKPEEGG